MKYLWRINRKFGSLQIGFNGGVPITEEFFAENIADKHNDDIAALLFPDDVQWGLKFTDEKEAMF
jgi:hypothetical protein